ncbi:MAG TPA: hypothetical protein ENH62_17165 [Marinobacter sp.]|uniref:Uncharacterized protein n=1 Tax=marine sediment metagenome TaxID=412755 RepID=A0A0F8W8C7_9ZZZZ|nr:hypothetical protein [Marinobacter sp.]
MSFLSSPKKKVTFVESATSLAAKQEVSDILKISGEGIPGREIAGFTELEQQAFDLASEFLRDDTGEITIDKAIDVATQIAEQKIDLNSPEIQGVIQEVRKTGDLALNRIGRSLQARGVASTTAGRDILGRQVTETEKATAGALAPLLTRFREQRLQATSLLPSLVGQRAGVTTGRIAVGAAAGEAQRSLAQQIKDAIFTRKQEQFGFETAGRANIASLLFESRTPVISGGGPSTLGKIASAGSDIASIISSASTIAGAFKPPVAN